MAKRHRPDPVVPIGQPRRPMRKPRLLAAIEAAQTDAPLPHVSALAFIALFTLPLLLVFLGTGDAVDMMELFNLVPVREAIRDHHWLMPTLNGVARLEKPPLPVWIPGGFATLMHSDSLWALRFPSLLMGMLTAFATYGLGCLFFKNPNDPAAAERKYGVLAAVLLPALLVFNREAHLATYDIYATAFLTTGTFFLALAVETVTKRRWIYAALAGVATGLSILSKGPVPVATVMVPLGIWILWHHRQARAWMTVAVAAGVSVLTFAPWLLAIGGIPGLIVAHEPRAWHVWYTELFQFGTGNAENPAAAGSKAKLTDPFYYYLQIFLWVAPLTPSLIAGLVMPFVPSQAEPKPSAVETRGRWLFWLVLVGGVLMLTVPSEKKPRYALQLFPFVALLCAALWQEFRRWPAAKKLDGPAILVLASQALFFIVPAIAGIVGVIWATTAESLPQWMGGITGESLRSLPRGLSLTMLLLTAAAGVYFWRTLFRREFRTALIALAGCSWLLVLTGQAMYRSAPSNHTNTGRRAVEQAMQANGPYPVYTLPERRPWLGTLFYANRIVPPMDLPALIQATAAEPQSPVALMVLTPPPGKDDPRLEATMKTFEERTQRQADFITSWTDDGKRIEFYHYAPVAPATAK